MKMLKTVALVLGLLVFGTATAMAQDATALDAEVAANSQRGLAAIGCGLVILGAGLGIGMLTRSAVESMARQPELAANIQTAMIISAALIEGVSFFALIIVLLGMGVIL